MKNETKVDTTFSPSGDNYRVSGNISAHIPGLQGVGPNANIAGDAYNMQVHVPRTMSDQAVTALAGVISSVTAPGSQQQAVTDNAAAENTNADA